MDYTIYIILAFLVIWIIFSKKIDAYLGKKLKSILNVDEELLKNKQTENTLFLRDKLITSSQTETSINPTIFKPKISRSLISIWFLFIVIGIVFTFIVTKDYKSIMQFFPLIWTIYGIVMMLDFYTTNYQLDDNALKVSSLFNTFDIAFFYFFKVEKRKINYGFRHGTKGRIRAETCSDTIFITSSKPIQRGKYTIMISPKNEAEFINLIKFKLSTNYAYNAQVR